MEVGLMPLEKSGRTLLLPSVASLSSSPLNIPPKLRDVPLVAVLGRFQSAYVAILPFCFQ